MLLQNVATAKRTLLSQCLAIIPEITSAPKLCNRGQFRSLLSPIPSTPRGRAYRAGKRDTPDSIGLRTERTGSLFTHMRLRFDPIRTGICVLRDYRPFLFLLSGQTATP